MRPQTAWLDCVIRFLPTSPEEFAEPVGITGIGGVQQQARRLDGIAGNHDIAGALKMPSPLAMVVHTCSAAVGPRLNPAYHGQVAHLGPGGQRARDPHS